MEGNNNMARFVLLGLKTSGLKSLEKTIDLQFYNHDIKDLSCDKSLIKAIYGTNGEGKTAIAHTLELYKNSIVNGDYLSAQSFDGSLQELINQHSQKVFIDIYFASIQNDKSSRIFHHIINYSLKDNRVYVSYEKLSECKGSYWGNPDGEATILEVREGTISDYYSGLSNLEKDQILQSTKNLLTNNSAAFSIAVYAGFKGDNRAHQHFSVAFMSLIMFALSLSIFIDKEDRQNVSIDQLASSIGNNSIKLGSVNYFTVGDGADEILFSEKEKYKKEIERIEKMLKVFKPNLNKIEIKYSDARGNKLICNKTLVYKNGDKVDLSYESTGIKKMVRLFNALSAVDQGGIVFVDEFDANIHDVYLCKLIEYFLEYTNGQFIFTTHNLGPMEVLDKKGIKHSIDFINKQIVTPWRRNGNYSVVKVYRNGMIPNSPFNINSIDFIKVFGGGNKNG